MSNSAQRALVVVLVKFPLPGQVKTRLAAEVGEEEAAAIHAKMVAAVGQVLARSPGADLCVYYTLASRAAHEGWLREIGFPAARHYWPQPEGDLGHRQAEAVRLAGEHGYEKVALIGTDCLAITPESFAQAWDLLDQAPLVFGPAADGGYYLLGLRLPFAVERLFAEVRWSSGQTLKDCQRNAAANGWALHDMEILNDIDFFSDWVSFGQPFLPKS